MNKWCFFACLTVILIVSGCQQAQEIATTTTSTTTSTSTSTSLIATTTSTIVTTTTSTTVTTTTLFPVQHSLIGLTLGMTSTEATAIKGIPTSIEVGVVSYNLRWGAYDAATFLNSDELILIGSTSSEVTLLGIQLLFLSGEVISAFGSPEGVDLLSDGYFWKYNSINTGFRIACPGASYESRVTGFYVFNGNIY